MVVVYLMPATVSALATAEGPRYLGAVLFECGKLDFDYFCVWNATGREITGTRFHRRAPYPYPEIFKALFRDGRMSMKLCFLLVKACSDSKFSLRNPYGLQTPNVDPFRIFLLTMTPRYLITNNFSYSCSS
jgi:hypothetical protein